MLLDSNYQIVGAESRLDAVLRQAELVEWPPHRLPALIERIVKELITAAAEDGEAFAEAAVPAHRLLVRSGILVGTSGNYVAVTLEKLRTREPLSGAAERFRLSPRELQVLTLIMSGFSKKKSRRALSSPNLRWVNISSICKDRGPSPLGAVRSHLRLDPERY